MNSFRFCYITLLIFLIPVSCNRNDDLANDIYNRWEIKDFISVESVLYTRDNDYHPVIEFTKNGSVSLKLDANSCIGNFSLSEQKEVKISMAGCTKICCDSDFSKKTLEMLSRVKSYSIEKNNMKLYVPEWGWISLELYH